MELTSPPVSVGNLTFKDCGKVPGSARHGFSPFGSSKPDEPTWYLGTWSQGTGPNIGDVRVLFRRVPCGDTTVVAVQHGSSFAPLAYSMHVVDGKVTRPAKG